MWWLLLLLVPVIYYVATNYSTIRVAKCGGCGKKADDIV